MRTITTNRADSKRQELLERYARLAIRVGLNLEPGRVSEASVRTYRERIAAKLRGIPLVERDSRA